MNRVLRIMLILLCWIGAAAAGWWWHDPSQIRQASAVVPAATSANVAEHAAPTPADMASHVAAADPMGLNRAALDAPNTAATGTPSSESITWRLSALVLRGAVRYAVMTASGQPSLQLSPGENLPDGDRIKAIHTNRIDIQSPRGRSRTLYLMEP